MDADSGICCDDKSRAQSEKMNLNLDQAHSFVGSLLEGHT